jgi:hypothetical protein
MEASIAPVANAGAPIPVEAAPKKGRRGAGKKAAPAEGATSAAEPVIAGDLAEKPKRPRAPRKKKEAAPAE